MVIHEIDGNSTWIEPMKNKTQGEMIKARRNPLKLMKLQGIVPLHQILDKETSEAYKEEILATKMSYQLVRTNNYRWNIAKRAIQTRKNHFIGVLAGTSATSPIHLWWQIIPQAERQLLLLSQKNLNPNISAYAYVCGQHDYNAAPFVFIGMESLVHGKTNKRKTFAEHCRKGYVLGTSFKHYRAWIFWMLNTRAIRVSATLFHKHKYISNPNVIPADAVIAAAGNLALVLKGEISSCL